MPRGLRALLAVALGLAAFMLANTAYLLVNRLAGALGWSSFTGGDTSLPELLQAMILTHTGIGLLLALFMLVFLGLHLPRVWKRRHRASIVSGLAYAVAGSGLVVTGLFILTEAASRDHRWVWWAHVISAALIPAGYVAHRIVSYTRPPTARYRRFVLAVAAGLALLLGLHGLTNRREDLTPEARAVLRTRLDSGSDDPTGDPSPYAADGFTPSGHVAALSPFFPSAATTATGSYVPPRLLTREDPPGQRAAVREEVDRLGFAQHTRIGAETCGRCHADIVAQWSASAHRFASFNNPFYEATVQDLRARSVAPNRWVEDHLASFPEASGVGRVKSQWCGGCHDPALMLTGEMGAEIDRATVEAQAGLTCLACHSIDRIHGPTGNGDYNFADLQEDPYLFRNAASGTWKALLHDAAVKARPGVHKRRMLKPFFRKAEFCSACHKVSLSSPVNNYRWLRGQDEYDNWHDSGVSLNASRTFYLPETRRVCQDCHMPLEEAPLGDVAAKNGKVRSHRFLAVNTALPFVRGDREEIRRIEAFLRDEKLGVDIFAITPRPSGRVVMAPERTGLALVAGERVRVDVVVRNKGVGHTFPGGTNDSNQGWLEFALVGETGRTIAVSGAVGKDGHLDPLAHGYHAVMLDRDGNPIQRRNAQDIHVTAAANVIGPGTADVAHYEFRIPPDAEGKTLTLRARLLWRKFNRPYTEFAYRANRDGFKRFEGVPDLPITEIAADELSLPVVRPGGADRHVERVPVPDSEWVRYNDYGIGLLLQGNTRAAALAFERVARLQPRRIDGPLNLARVALRDGNLERAYRYLQEVEKIRAGDARAAWVWGNVLQEDGRYGDAELAYRRVLETFPRDRATWRKLGRTLYLNQRYEDALEAFRRVLKIDPEDRVARYHLMLCHRALGREREAEVAGAAYEYYRVDESAQEITRSYRAAHPGVNLMAQAIHTHHLSPADASR
ncbi:MAG: tetratricopeptide repeat protein [Gemmatimonadota bacterium]